MQRIDSLCDINCHPELLLVSQRNGLLLMQQVEQGSTKAILSEDKDKTSIDVNTSTHEVD